jgi:hypothetical protein
MTETSHAPTQTQTPIPAGWYPDPRGTKQRRWWDGNAWTHALEAPPEPVAPATPAYANLPGPGTPAYANLPGPAMRTPSPNAPTVRRALDPEANAEPEQQPLPSRRQLREAAAALELQRQLTEPKAPSPVYAMGPAVSQTFAPVDAAPARTATTFTPAAAPAAATAQATETGIATAAPSTPAAPAAVPVALPVTAPAALPVALPITAPTAESAVSNPVLSSGPAYQPFGLAPKITTGLVEAPTSVNTPAVWLITVLPAVALGIASALIAFAPDFYTPFTQGALAFVLAVAAVALAVNDRRQLTLRSHQATASPAWILLTPLAYLVARASNTKKQAGRGWAPALVFLLLAAGATTLVYFSGLPIETFVVA